MGEFKRQRGEELRRIDLLSAEANRNPFLGISSIPGGQSGFSQLANSVLGSAGQSIGSDPSGFLSGLKGLFGGGGTASSSARSLNLPSPQSFTNSFASGAASALPKF